MTFGGPAGITRYAVRDFELRGRTIRKGQMLMLSFAGANRDPSVFPDPDAFDIDRDTRESLVFGNGPHFCLGSHLARVEMESALGVLLDRLPGLRLKGAESPAITGAVLRGPTAIPVVFEPS